MSLTADDTSTFIRIQNKKALPVSETVTISIDRGGNTSISFDR